MTAVSPRGDVRTFDVGTSVEALAMAWARQENAPAGATVVLGSEIAGRLRGGTPWTHREPDALMMAVVHRPALSLEQEPLLWLAGTIAAARAAADSADSVWAVHWPDRVFGADGGEDSDEGAVNVRAQLGPGRVEHAVIAIRVRSAAGLTGDQRMGFVDRARTALAERIAMLESDPGTLVDEFIELWPNIGERVRATLVPRGEARGRVVTIDPKGQLVLESPTGMLERVQPAHLRSLDLV